MDTHFRWIDWIDEQVAAAETGVKAGTPAEAPKNGHTSTSGSHSAQVLRPQKAQNRTIRAIPAGQFSATMVDRWDTPIPRASWPRLPEADGVPPGAVGMLAWEWARTRLEEAKNYWVVTVRPDGRPHAVPVWGAWVDRCSYCAGGGVQAATLG